MLYFKGLLLALLLTSVRSESRRPVLHKPPSSLKTGCYIISIKEKATETEVQELLARVIKVSDDHKMYGLVQKATRALTVKLSAYSLEMVRGMNAVDYIEEEGFATGDNSDEILQWHLDRLDQTGYPLDLSYAPISDGEGIDIFILDTGINFDHEEFEYRAKYAGYDPVDEYALSNDLQENYQRIYGRDCHGHGTHVASLAAGKTYGSAKKANVYSVRVLSCNNAAPWSVVLDGIDYVSELVSLTKRPAVVSMSLSGDFYRIVNEAMAGLESQGIHVVVAAGNGGVDACSRSPASSSAVLTVGGSRNGDGFYLLGSGSNFGSCVNIFAPGERILAADWKCANCCRTLSGTSMSTPIVSGVVAVHLGRQPLTSPEDMRTKIIAEGLSGVLSFDGVPTIYHGNTPNVLLHLPGSCGADNFFRSYTLLRSPNYPQLYPDNLDCRWHLRLDPGLQIVVNISSVRLEGNYDTLNLFEGECCNSTHIVAQFTGDLGTVDYIYTSKSGEVTLQLLTDGSVGASGFTGSFTKIYSGTNIKVPEPEIPETSPGLTRPSDVISLRSLTPKRARSEVATLLGQGYKVSWITTHKTGLSGRHAFDVVLSNNTGVDTRVLIDLTADQLHDSIVEMAHEGYSISSLADRERGSGDTVVSYTALFRPTNHVLTTEVYLGDSLDVWRQRMSEKKRSGHRLVSQSFVEFRGVVQVSTVYTIDRRLAHNITIDPPQALVSIYNLTFFDFTSQMLDYARKNYYLDQLEIHEESGLNSARFSIILLAHNDQTITRAPWFRWGLDEETTASRLSTEAASWDPHIVAGYSHQGVVFYFLSFTRHVR